MKILNTVWKSRNTLMDMRTHKPFKGFINPFLRAWHEDHYHVKEVGSKSSEAIMSRRTIYKHFIITKRKPPL